MYRNGSINDFIFAGWHSIASSQWSASQSSEKTRDEHLPKKVCPGGRKTMVCVHAIALRRLPMPTPPPLLRNAPCTQVNGAKTNGSHSNEGEMKRLEEIIVKSLDGTTLYVVLWIAAQDSYVVLVFSSKPKNIKVHAHIYQNAMKVSSLLIWTFYSTNNITSKNELFEVLMNQGTLPVLCYV